jgi:hypothetical protein
MVRPDILRMLTPEQGARTERGEAAPRATPCDSSID